MTGRPTAPRITALDGVRGVALIAILAYHANPAWLPGAPLAVTTFFTLSGFLITSLLVREIESTGRVDLRSFWVRRARRLVPGSIIGVVLIAILVGAGLRELTPGLVGDAASALTWTANWHFVSSGSTYSALFNDPSPFQHFWSLAVEEQVYLLLPLSAIVLLGRRGSRLRFATFVVAGIVLSTIAASVTQMGGHAYYGTDARLAEPFVGVLLALLLTRADGFVTVARSWVRVVDVVGCAALAGLVVLMTQLSVDDPRLYRGGFLAGAVLAAVVIFAGTQDTAIGRALSFRPFVALGTISYAVYLFHWPIFEWIDPDGTAEPRRLVLEVGLTLALAALSTHLIETPIRRRGVRTIGVFTAGWANATVAALAVVAVASTMATPSAMSRVDLGYSADDPVPPPPVVGGRAAPATAPATSLAAASSPIGHGRRSSSPTSTPPTTSAPVAPEEAALLTGGDHWSDGQTDAPPPSDGSQLRVAVVGDSLAHNLARGLATWSESNPDVVVYDLSVSFCPLSRGGERRWEEDESFTVNSACAWWTDPASERATNLRAFAPDVILDVAPFSELLDRKLPDWEDWRKPGESSYHRWLIDEYSTMFDQMGTIAGGNARFLTLNAPCGDFTRPRGWRRVDDPNGRVQALDDGFYPLLVRSTQGDLFSQLCPNGEYSDDLWGIDDARPDGMHLSDEAGAELARRWLGPLVEQTGGRAQPATPIGTPPGT
jgi:peptidoglycan/LPS O-acetylase OafA/YrhL